MPKVASKSEMVIESLIVSQKTSAIMFESSDSRLKAVAVKVRVIPKPTRLYTITPRKRKETTKATKGSTIPKATFLQSVETEIQLPSFLTFL